MEITAFLASLSKVCSILQSGSIPANVNLSQVNAAIHWDEFKMRVPRTTERLTCRSPSGKSLISMTSSGIGGSNGHCVVESAPSVEPPPSTFWIQEPSHFLVVAGGLSPRSASAVIDVAKQDSQTEALGDLALTYSRRARSLPWRSFAVLNEPGTANFSKPQLAPSSRPSKVFVFSGQGPQHMLSTYSCDARRLALTPRRSGPRVVRDLHSLPRHGAGAGRRL